MTPLLRAALVALACLPLAALAQDSPEIPTDLGSPLSGESRQLSLQEAIQLALQHNLRIDLSRTGPAIAVQRERAAWGAFDITAQASGGFHRTEQPSSSPFFGTGLTSDDWRYVAGLNGQIPLGLRYSSSFTLQRGETSSSIENLERKWDGTLENQIALPLMRGLFDNPANIAVKQSALQSQMSEEDFRRELIDAIAQVEQSYWGLSTALAQDRVALKSLGRARDLLEQTRIQFEVGVVSKVEVAQARAGVAEREVNAINARNALENQQDLLLDATLAPSYSTFRQIRLEPAMPVYREFDVNEPTAVEIALNSRPEMITAHKAVAQAELGVDLAKNNRLPQLDVVGSATFRGLTGNPKHGCDTFSRTSIEAANAPFDCDDPADRATIAIDPSLGDSGDVMRDTKRSWSLTGQFSVPIGNVTARARAAEAELMLHRARRQLAMTRQSIVLDVRRAVRTLLAAVKAYQAAERRQEAATESLRAEQERLRLGDSTPFKVLEVEEDLVEAETQVNGSLQVLQDSITGVQRSQGTLLQARGVSLEAELDR